MVDLVGHGDRRDQYCDSEAMTIFFMILLLGDYLPAHCGVGGAGSIL